MNKNEKVPLSWVLLKGGIGKRDGKNCSDWLNFYLKYYTLNKNTLYIIKAIPVKTFSLLL
jgi:hypothetical protein